MSDLLSSILGSMQGPPSLSIEEKKKRDELRKQEQNEKEALRRFKLKLRSRVQAFVKDGDAKKLPFPPMNKVQRAVLHDIAEVAGLASFSFGEEGADRHLVLWKKEFAPSDDELACLRRGKDWTPEVAAKMKLEKEEAASTAVIDEPTKTSPKRPHSGPSYTTKYEHLIGQQAGKDAANTMGTNKCYGFVSAENKTDRRTIEQVLADNRARKKLKTSHLQDRSSEQGNYDQGTEAASSANTNLSSKD